MADEIPVFRNLVKQVALDGDKIKIDEILGKDIVVCAYRITESKYKDKGCRYCIKVQFYYDGDERTKMVFFSGSSVIKDQLEEAEATLKEQKRPFLFKTAVKKVGKYYSLV